jgi:nitrogen fixation-related uncharacterized protein
MSSLLRYYVSRTFVSIALGALLAATGSPWWMAVLAGVTVLAFFLWAPRSGRYAVHPEQGVTPLRRDERTQMISDRAARNAFVATVLMIAGTAVYFGTIARADVPVGALTLALVLGALTYSVSDFWLRRT